MSEVALPSFRRRSRAIGLLAWLRPADAADVVSDAAGSVAVCPSTMAPARVSPLGLSKPGVAAPGSRMLAPPRSELALLDSGLNDGRLMTPGIIDVPGAHAWYGKVP